MNKRMHMTVPLILQAYQMRKDGKTYPEIIQATGIKTPGTTLKLLEKALAGQTKGRRRVYISAAKMIRDNTTYTMKSTNGSINKAPIKDALTMLDDAFVALKDAMVAVIEEEATRRADKVLSEERAKTKEMQLHYERELQRMQEIIVDAQNSSVVGVLKKKWGLTS